MLPTSNTSFSSATVTPCLFLHIVVLGWKPVLVLRIPSYNYFNLFLLYFSCISSNFCSSEYFFSSYILYFFPYDLLCRLQYYFVFSFVTFLSVHYSVFRGFPRILHHTSHSLPFLVSVLKYCCLCILIVSLCVLIVVYVFKLLSMYSYCCLCILRRDYPD